MSANTVFPEGSDNLVIPTTKAIWTVDNNTLTFLDSNTTYKAGDSYNGQTVTNVWYGAEVTATSGTESAPDAPGWQEIVAPTLTEVVFDSSFKNVKPKSFGKWFQNCSKLTTFTGMENLVTTDCVNMSYMFDGCSSLTSLDLSHFNTANTTANAFRFLYVFRNCSSLKSLDLSNFNNVSMMWGQWIEGVFYGCSSLEMIDFSSFSSLQGVSIELPEQVRQKFVDFGKLGFAVGYYARDMVDSKGVEHKAGERYIVEPNENSMVVVEAKSNSFK